MIHQSRSKVPCDECGKLLFEEGMRIHKKVHNLNARVTCICDECGQQVSQASLKNHKESVHGSVKSQKKKRKYVCPTCNFKTSSSSLLMHHCYKKHDEVHPQGAPVHQCAKCDYKSPSKTQVRSHEKANHGEPLAKQQCDICFKYYLNIRHHKTTFHKGKRYECQSCKTFSTLDKNNFLHHNYCKHGIVLPEVIQIHKCDECDFKSPAVRIIHKHVKLRHPKVTSYKCFDTNCDKTFPNLTYRLKHYRRIHLSAEAGSCPECKRGKLRCFISE